VNILYQEGDKLENFVVNVPVFALDEKGMPVSVDVSNLALSGLSSGVTSGSTTMTAGLAVVPLTITSSNPETLKLEVSTASVDGGVRVAARVSTRNPLALVIPVVVIAAEDVAGLFIGLGLAIGDLLHPTPPQQPYADWVGTQESFGDLSYPVTQFPPVFGGSCAPGLFSFPGVLANNGNAPINVPLVEDKPGEPDPKFDRCKEQIPPDWKPLAKDSPEYQSIKDKILNKYFGDGQKIFTEPKLESSVTNQYASQKYAGNQYGNNRLQASQAEINTLKNSPSASQKILTQVEYDAQLAKGGNKGSNLYGHLLQIRQTLNSTAKALRNRGLLGEFKKSPSICLSTSDLEILNVLYDVIKEILSSYNIPW
jgi:hypothetical protein